VVSDDTVSSKGLESIVQVGDIMYSREGMIRCPLDNTFSLIGKRFTVHILRNMMSNQTRFNQFIETIDGINPKTLSTRLKEMEKNGLIQRKIYHETPVRIEYDLTQKGKNLKPILDEMALFSARFCVKDVFRNGKPRTYKEISSIIS
jgi:DNA-binding HxlR family transcriptional regulator